MERANRLRLVHAVTYAVLDRFEASAIHWLPSQRLVEPASYLASVVHGAPLRDSAVNVRLFRIADGEPDECVMDTLGLAPLGLPDLQCHFAGLDPGAIADLLLAYAAYCFEKGPVLGDDSLVRGVTDGEEWDCKRAESLVMPQRDVVDIVAGEHAIRHG
jgi:hypothetical protein